MVRGRLRGREGKMESERVIERIYSFFMSISSRIVMIPSQFVLL